MTKKVLALLLAVALLVAMVPLSVGAAETPTSGTFGAEEDNLTWSFDKSTGTLTISGKGSMDAKEDAMASYSYGIIPADEIRSVVILPGVTDIGEVAFYGYSSLTSVTIPDSVTRIGQSAFYDCTSLTNVIIPGSVTSIGVSAFAECESLTSVTIQDGVTCIEANAFEDCVALTSVTIPDSVTSIGEWAFLSCTALTSLTIPSSVTQIGTYAFRLTPWLDSLCKSNNGLGIINGILLQYQGEESVVTIPSNVTRIGGYAFSGCDSLTSVTIPDSVTSIGELAFGACDSLTSVTIPNSVTSIGRMAFEDCMGLTNVTILGNKTEFGEYAIGYYWGATRMPDLTITGYTGTPAEKYAKDNSFKFVALDASKFTDVKSSDYFYAPVQWAVANNVTSGTSATTFSPNQKCTRAEAMTFLWAAANKPEPKTTTNPFTDVKSSDYYYKAVLWAVENGITSGTSATTFGPKQVCSRAQIMTFLYAYEKKPAASGTNPFKDVPSGAYYYQPVLWAVQNEITAGTSATTFGSNDACTRGQIMTFLYKDMT